MRSKNEKSSGFVIPDADRGSREKARTSWIPACAGMTVRTQRAISGVFSRTFALCPNVSGSQRVVREEDTGTVRNTTRPHAQHTNDAGYSDREAPGDRPGRPRRWGLRKEVRWARGGEKRGISRVHAAGIARAIASGRSRGRLSGWCGRARPCDEERNQDNVGAKPVHRTGALYDRYRLQVPEWRPDGSPTVAPRQPHGGPTAGVTTSFQRAGRSVSCTPRATSATSSADRA